jgi:hypothetical protein
MTPSCAEAFVVIKDENKASAAAVTLKAFLRLLMIDSGRCGCMHLDRSTQWNLSHAHRGACEVVHTLLILDAARRAALHLSPRAAADDARPVGATPDHVKPHSGVIVDRPVRF